MIPSRASLIALETPGFVTTSCVFANCCSACGKYGASIGAHSRPSPNAARQTVCRPPGVFRTNVPTNGSQGFIPSNSVHSPEIALSKAGSIWNGENSIGLTSQSTPVCSPITSTSGRRKSGHHPARDVSGSYFQAIRSALKNAAQRASSLERNSVPS